MGGQHSTNTPICNKLIQTKINKTQVMLFPNYHTFISPLREIVFFCVNPSHFWDAVCSRFTTLREVKGVKG